MSLTIPIIPNAALLVVDVQRDFLPNGALVVKEGNRIIQPINEMMPSFKYIVCSKDDHPNDHKSFTSYGGKWPAHCIHNTGGQEFPDELKFNKFTFTALKGTSINHDSYSAFYVGGYDSMGHPKSTGLNEYLRKKKITTLVVCGIATDFCVKTSVLNAIDLGYQCFVPREATAAVYDQEGALKAIECQGAKVIEQWGDASIQTILGRPLF